MIYLRTTRQELLQTLLLSTVGGVGMTYFTCTSCHSSFKNYMIVASFSTAIWVTMWIGNNWLAHYLNEKISWFDFPVRRLLVGIVGTVFYSVAVLAMLTSIWGYFFAFDLGDFFYTVTLCLIMTVFISLVMYGRAFLINWKESAVNATKFERESMKAQYESLKSQVNPHFLFNSLNALTNLVHENPDKAVRFIKQLSDVYRYVLDTRSREVVSLEEELAFLKSYLFLQQIRFGSKLKVEVSLQGVRSLVAPLALQMLVENAIKHNIISEDAPLSIRLFSEDGKLVVENNLQRKRSLDEGSAGLGLENIRKRYEFLAKAKVEVSEASGKFKVSLPVIEAEA